MEGRALFGFIKHIVAFVVRFIDFLPCPVHSPYTTCSHPPAPIEMPKPPIL